MSVEITATERWYPGFQKIRPFRDDVVRKCFALCAGYAVLTLVFYYLLGGRHRESMYIVLNIVYFGPATIALAGGFSAGSWRWYAVSSVLLIAGMVPPAEGGSPYFMAAAVPGLACLGAALWKSPRTLKAMGYIEKTPVSREIFTTVVAAAVLTALFCLAILRAMGGRLDPPPPHVYLWTALSYTLLYFFFYGMAMGICAKHLLDLRCPLILPLALNAVFISLKWITDVAAMDDVVKGLFGTLAFSLLSQFTLGMAFFFNRSSRTAFLSHLLYYLVYKSFVT